MNRIKLLLFFLLAGLTNHARADDSLEVIIQGVYPKGRYEFYLDSILLKDRVFKEKTSVSYQFYIKIDTNKTKDKSMFRVVISANKKSEQTVFFVQKLEGYKLIFIYKEFYSTKRFSYNIKYDKNYIKLNDDEEISTW